MEIIIEITELLFQINLHLQLRKNICQKLKNIAQRRAVNIQKNLPTRGNTVTEELVDVKN